MSAAPDLSGLVPITLKQLQAENEESGYTILNDASAEYLLNNKYKLSYGQVNKIYKTKVLYPDEAYVKAVTYLGDLGYEQHLYMNSRYALINAIQNRNDELISYYLFRTNLIKNTNTQNLLSLCIYYALKNKDDFTLALLHAYFGTFYVESIPYAPRKNSPVPYSDFHIVLKESFINTDLNLVLNYLHTDPDIYTLSKFINIVPQSLVLYQLITYELIDLLKQLRPILLKQLQPSVYLNYLLLQIQILLGEKFEISDELKEQLPVENLEHLYVLEISVCNYVDFGVYEEDFDINLLTYLSEVIYSPREVFELLFALKAQGKPIMKRLVISCFLTHKAAEMYDHKLPNSPLEQSLNEVTSEVNTPEELIHVYNHDPTKNMIVTPLNEMNEVTIKNFLAANNLTWPSTWQLQTSQDKRKVADIMAQRDGYYSGKLV